MAVAFGIDTLHLLAEESAVGGGVAEMVDGDVVMDHLMKDGVLHEFFRQVNAGIDTQNEVGVVPIAEEEPLPTLDKSQFAQERTRMAQFDGNRRQLPAKEAGVVFVETGLYVVYGWYHIRVFLADGPVMVLCIV